MADSVRGSLPQIFRNDAGLYEGDLIPYLKAVFTAPNTDHPYHNFRHMLHVTFLCHDACAFYRDVLSPRQMRNLLIAAAYHDFDHCGMRGDDATNIARAIAALERDILPIDRPHLSDIGDIIRATEYRPQDNPPRIEAGDLCAQILQDADLGQSFSVAWMQQVVFGLAAEWNMPPIAVLRMQEGFHRSLRFNTEWARAKFPQEVIDEKIREATELLQLLDDSEREVTAAAA